MVIEQGRRNWHTTPKEVKRVRGFFVADDVAAIIGMTALAGAGAGASTNWFGLGGKKKSKDVPDPLAGLRSQLQALAGQIPAQVAKQKEINAARAAEARTTGMQGIAENIRAERGFGNTSLQDRLNTELLDKLTKSQAEADLSAENWGLGEQSRILMGTAGMYPSQTELPEEDMWGPLLSAGASMLGQNWMQEQQYKNLAKYFPSAFGGSGGGGYDDDYLSALTSKSLVPKTSISSIKKLK